METSSRDTEEGLFPDEERFAIQLAVVGTPAPVIAAAVPDLQAELEQRTYLRTRRVVWDPDAQRAIVDVEDVGYDPPKHGGRDGRGTLRDRSRRAWRFQDASHRYSERAPSHNG